MIDPFAVSVPDTAVSSLAEEAIGLGESAGVYLDEEQQLVLHHSLGIRADNKWASFRVGVCAPRQNGKNEILIVRQLAGLFLFPWERLIIHSAHLFKTSTEHQRRLEEVVQNTPELHKRVKPRGYRHSHGEEGIELRDGTRINFVTRTATGGRGLTGDLVSFDEAMILAEATMGALMPTMSARSQTGNPQMWYQGSAVDQVIHKHGVVFSRLRARGQAGNDPRLAWFEWAAAIKSAVKGRAALPADLTMEMALDERFWAQANTALDKRIAREFVLAELDALDLRTFAVERLGVWDPPDLDGDESLIDIDAWDKLVDKKSKVSSDFVFTFDVAADRSSSAIAVVGMRPTGGFHHVEVVAHNPGTSWVVPWLKQRVPKHKPLGVACDSFGQAPSLVPELAQAGIEVRLLSAAEYAAGCGLFFDAAKDGTLRHTGQPALRDSIKASKSKALASRFKWMPVDGGDITPIVAVSVGFEAWWLEQGFRHPTAPMVAYA